MENITQEAHKLPLLEQSSDERLISYAIYPYERADFPGYNVILLKYISFRGSKAIQRDESFAIISKNYVDLCLQMQQQGFAMFGKHPDDDPALLNSFM